MYTAALLAASLVGNAMAAVHRVDVGMDGLQFTPDSITAAMGDILEYHFHAPNHSATMGDFSNPCEPAASGGFFSGFMIPSGSNAEADNVFQVTVNSTDPVFFFCSQNIGSHCKAGMAGVVNPSKDQTLAAYKDAAKSIDQAGVPASVFGGNVIAASKAMATDAPSSSPSPASGGSGESGGGRGGLYGGGGGGGGGSGAGSIGASAGVVAALALGAAAMLL